MSPFFMKHPFHLDTLTEIIHYLWDVVESFGKDFQEIGNKPDDVSLGEQALAHVSVPKPLMHNTFYCKNKLDEMKNKFIE